MAENDNDERETITVYEVPPLFFDPDKEDEPLLQQIETVYVFKKLSNGQVSCLDWRPVQDLQDEIDLLKAFGPGTYMLQGRGANRGRVVRQVYRTVGIEESTPNNIAAAYPLPAMPAVTKDAATALTAIGGMVLSFFEKAAERAARERELTLKEQLAAQEREAERQRQFLATMKTQSDETLRTITQLTQARVGDLEAIIRGQVGHSGGGNNGGGMSADTLSEAIALIETIREGSEPTAEARFAELLSAFT